jgi:hypothetical protein
MKRQKQESRNRRRKRLYESKPEPGESKYGRKRRWLDRMGFWGFEIPEPKPWK